MASVSEVTGSITAEAFRPFSEVQKGFTPFRDRDVIVAKITPCFENGKIAHARISKPLAFGSTEFHVLRARKNLIDDRYLFHFLRQPNIRESGEKRMTGSGGQRRVPKQFLEELQIPLPSLAEQRRIAAILDKADALRAKRRDAIIKLDQLLQSVFLEMFGDPVTNPKDWPIKTLEELILFTGGSQPAKETFSSEPLPGYVRLVQIRDFRTDKYQTYIPDSLARRRFTEADVMIGRYGPPVFQIFRGLSGSYNVALMKAEPRSPISNEFLFHLLRSDTIQKLVVANSERSAGQSGVNLDFLHSISVGTPPILLQKQFERTSSQVAATRAACIETEKLGDQLFQSLQDAAFR